jgi:hypothetical protein
LRCKYRQLGDMPPGSNVSIAQSSAHASSPSDPAQAAQDY